MATKKFTLRYAFRWSGIDTHDDFFSGKFLQSKFLSLSRFVLLNLSNVTLEQVTESMMKAQLGNYAKRLPINSLIFKCLDSGFVHTVAGWTTVLKKPRYDTEHYSPIFPSEEIKLITVIEPESNNNNTTEIRLSLGGFGQFVWETIIMCIISMSIVSMMFKRIRHKTRGKTLVFIEYLWFYISTLLENQATAFSKGLSLRIMLSFWILAATVLIKSFSGNLKSNLAVSKTQRINSLEDLQNYSGTRLTLYLLDDYLRKLKSEKVKLNGVLLEEIPYRGNLYILNDGPNYVLLGNVVRFKEDMRSYKLDYLRKTGKKIYIGEEVYFGERYYFYFYKPTIPRRVLENIDYLVYRFMETSQFVRRNRLEDRAINQFMASDKGETAINAARTMTVEELSIIFKIWSCGMVIASIILIGEIVIHCRVKERSKRLPKIPHRPIGKNILIYRTNINQRVHYHV